VDTVDYFERFCLEYDIHGHYPIIRVPHKIMTRKQQQTAKRSAQQINSNRKLRINNNSKKNSSVANYRPPPRDGAFNSLGGKLGAALGHGAQMLLKHITGFGDYNVKTNSLMNGGLSPPQIVNSSSNGGVIFRHREYIMDIVPTSAFAITTLDINPGLIGTFPWLAQVADAFEQYTVRGMIFEYRSTSSDSVVSTNANAALGSVIMATQYNSLSAPFVDKKSMENYQFACSDKPSQTFIHPIECARGMTSVSELYIRTGSVPVGSDQRLYDLGAFSIATVGMQSTTGVMGELWVTFEIEMYKPKLISNIGVELYTDKWYCTNSTGTAPLGTVAVQRAGSNLGTTIVANVVTFPVSVTDGTYLFDYVEVGTAATITAPLITLTNATIATIFNNDTTTVFSCPNNAIAVVTNFSQTFVILITGAAATVTFGVAGTIPTAGKADLIISQINPYTT
jgi:hypothetical protein